MKNLFYILNELPKSRIIALSIVLFLLISLLDFYTKFNISLLYILPIFLLSNYISIPIGIVAALTSLTSILINSYIESNSLSIIKLGNISIECIFFFVFIYLIKILKDKDTQITQLAGTDFLTGVLNIKSFYEKAKIEIGRSYRYSHPITFGYIDIDNFKSINNKLGYLVGDSILYTIANLIKKHIRSSDIIVRLGGDEFGILLPEAGVNAATPVFTKIEHIIKEQFKDYKFPITFTIGVITFLNSPESIEDMISKTDTLMYRAKQEGKNRIKYDVVD